MIPVLNMITNKRGINNRLTSVLYNVMLMSMGCTGIAHDTDNKESLDFNYQSGIEAADIILERLTTIAPFPRGLEMVDNKLYILCRGRVRGAGGVSAEIDDQAGTLYVVNPEITEPYEKGDPSARIVENGKVFALPTDPPFNLWDRTANPPEMDRLTDRPYCSLRYHDPTKSFYICAFSGIDKSKVPGQPPFSKNLTDALLRYDLRTGKWYEVERHNVFAGGSYPHHDPQYNPPPHGWLNGADNCLAVGNYMYAVAKDNSVLIRYDLNDLVNDPEAGYPDSEFVLGAEVYITGIGMVIFKGHSALAVNDKYLYIASRTSSLVIRIELDENGYTVNPYEAQLVAKFTPYSPQTGKSANITDMAFDSKGNLYVISAQPARIYCFYPDPERIFDATLPDIKPWADLAAITENPVMKSENIFIDNLDRIYVTSGDGYSYQQGANGTVYRIMVGS